MQCFVKLIKIFLSISLVLPLLTPTAWAQNKGGECKIWPEQFPTESDGFLNVFSGKCKDGMADGKGIVRSYSTFSPGFDASALDKNKPRYEFEGYFRQGAFVGKQYYKGNLLFGRQDVITMLDKSKGSEVWIKIPVERKKPLNFCASNRINVAVENYGKYKTDIDQSKKILDKAYDKFLTYCPDFNQWMDVILYEMKDAKRFVGNSGDITSRFDARSGNKAEHRNVFYDRAKDQKELEAENKKRQQEMDRDRNEIVGFFKKWKVTQLTTVNQLIKNPFRFEKKTVAIPVELMKMISASEALVIAPKDLYNPIRLSGITPDLFNDQRLLMVVNVTGKSERNGATYTDVSYVAHRACLAKWCEEIEVLGLTNYGDKK